MDSSGEGWKEASQPLGFKVRKTTPYRARQFFRLRSKFRRGKTPGDCNLLRIYLAMNCGLGMVIAPLKGTAQRRWCMKRIFLSVAGFVTLFGLMAAPVQSTVPATPTLQTQAQPEAETFLGTIMKNGENFVSSDSATTTGYMLDSTKK